MIQTPFSNAFRRLALTSLLFVAASLFALPCRAEQGDDAEFVALQATAKDSFEGKAVPFIKNYCFKCHCSAKTKGEVNFEPALKNPGESAFSKHWKEALANVQTHDMPPDNAAKQPTDEERQVFVECMAKVKFLAPKDPGIFVMRRLTKAEYGNTLHDLFGVDPAVVKQLPDEVVGEGYLNTLSPLQMEQYLGIADEVLDQVLAPAGSPPTEVQMRLFGEPLAPDADERAAARNVARSLTRSAYRRPASEKELDVLLSVFDLGKDNKLPYQGALRLMLEGLLVSPQFLFITPTAESRASGDVVPLDDYQLASRLSYLLWATMPDAELSALADQGKLHEPEVLKAQVQRLLEDSRSRALFDGFGAQWLGVGNLESKAFDTAKFPQITPEMRQAMYEEARLFFQSIVRENRSIVDFVAADYTFLNNTLAPLYGLQQQVTGPEMRKVQLTDHNRGGILAMPGILATTSFPNRSSPVRRGVWVLEQVLGEEIPPPPPNVPALDKQDEKTVATMTIRQRTELHRSDVVCANCHKILDPIGFGLENFDAIGRWRDQDDSGGAVDAAGELPGGKHFTTPQELKTIIADRKDDLTRTLTEKLMAYALCRHLEGYDEILVDKMVASVAKESYQMQTLITEIVTSYPFTHRRITEQLASTSK